MRRALLMVLMPLLAQLSTVSLADEPAKKVVIPFDFESRFDDGRYGQIVGDMVWKKLKDQGGFILPETMQDVRDWCQRTKTLPNPDTSLDALKGYVVKDQGGDIAVWGKVERVPGAQYDEYDVWINVADFSVDPPRMIHSRKARTKTVSEIPHVHVKEALDALYGREPSTPAGIDPAKEKRWASAPNLVRGDFEKGTSAPAGWDPLRKEITWVPEHRGSKNHVIKFTFDEEVAGGTGVLYYSAYFPVDEGATYRFQCRWKSDGPAAKVFIKCYDDLATPELNRDAKGTMSASQKREVYRSQQNLEGARNVWNTQTEDFTPKHTQFTPRWGRVMLYAYWPAGSVEWDDVVVKQVAPAPAGVKKKVKRPSLETKVSTDEIR